MTPRYPFLALIAFLLATASGCGGLARHFQAPPAEPEPAVPELPVEISLRLHEELLREFMERHPPAKTTLGPVRTDEGLDELVVGRLRELGYGIDDTSDILPFRITVRRVNGGGHVAAIVQGGDWTLSRAYSLESGMATLISSSVTGE